MSAGVSYSRYSVHYYHKYKTFCKWSIHQFPTCAFYKHESILKKPQRIVLLLKSIAVFSWRKMKSREP